MSKPFVFTQGPKFLQKPNPLPSLNNRYSPVILAKNQKSFTAVNPVKPYRRFPKGMIADTGINPEQTFIDFINKDVKKPLNRSELRLESEKYIPSDPLKWSVNCTYRCNDEKLLPKYSYFKNYNFSKRNEDDVKNYKNFFLETDHISIRPRVIKSYDKNSFLNVKSKYGPFSESKDCWIPKTYKNGTVANLNSVPYNIINNLDDNISGKRGNELLDKTLNNRKKGIAEFEDIKNPSNPKFNKEFHDLINENNKIFYNVKGAFSDLYDAAAKNGNIYLPFRRQKI